LAKENIVDKINMEFVDAVRLGSIKRVREIIKEHILMINLVGHVP
jgi:hypothetical protein